MLKDHSGQSRSVWMTPSSETERQPLRENADVDVCVVGAGISGLTTAYLLAKEGKSVMVLDDGPIGGGQTERTTAHLSNEIDDRYVEIERLHGPEGAKLAAASHSAAIDRIEKIIRDEQIDCDFERLDGYLFMPPGISTTLLDEELAAAHRAGLSMVEKVPRAPIQPFDTGMALRFPRQAQFHPLKYLLGLAKAIESEDVRICTGTHAERIDGGKPGRVKVAGGKEVTARAIVVATNTPVNDLVAIHTKQAPYLTYVIGALVPRGSVARALFWDTEDPYHYVRLQSLGSGGTSTDPISMSEFDLLIVGGEDHKTGQADDHVERYVRLEVWARDRFPMISEVSYRWSGQVMESIDGLAFIGHNPMDEPNVFIATGDSGMGMTHGTIAGMLITDLICGRANPWTTLYDPSRKTIRATGEFMKENLNVAMRYGDWLTGGDLNSINELMPGQGGLIRHGLTKIAAYRDEQGTLHEHSAVCPHLGCLVDWNDAEKTWDCPCHGSRFDALGTVIEGPANSNLSKVHEEEVQKTE